MREKAAGKPFTDTDDLFTYLAASIKAYDDYLALAGPQELAGAIAAAANGK